MMKDDDFYINIYVVMAVVMVFFKEDGLQLT